MANPDFYILILSTDIDEALRAVLEDNEERNFKLERDISNLYSECREASLEVKSSFKDQNMPNFYGNGLFYLMSYFLIGGKS